MSKRKSQRGSDGCGYLLFVCLAACVMLAFNGFVVVCLYSWFKDDAPPAFQNPRFAQAMMFVTPVAMLFIEWWLIDRYVDRKQQRKSNQT